MLLHTVAFCKILRLSLLPTLGMLFENEGLGHYNKKYKQGQNYLWS